MTQNLDIKSLKPAKRYALALIEASDDHKKILKDLNLIKETIFQNDEFRVFFLHPVISLKDKKEIIKSALSDKIEKTTMNFIETLLDENRLSVFNSIKEIYEQEYDKIKNRQKINVTSAIELQDSQKERLEECLKEKLKKDVILNFEQNENIIGGLIINFNDKIIDLSLKTKFDNLKKIEIN